MSLEVLAEAIDEYRREGAELMERLGRKFGYDISEQEQFDEFICKGNPKVPRRGKLSDRVNYAFHGCQCYFYKKKSQQRIDVELSNPPEFGEIDAWFLKNYLDSTDAYKELSRDLDWQDLKPMLRQLYSSGRIEEIGRERHIIFPKPIRKKSLSMFDYLKCWWVMSE